MIGTYLDDFQNGTDEGVDRALEITLQDPSFRPTRAEDIQHFKTHQAGRYFGMISGGAIGFVFFDLATLGGIPLFNYLKYHRGPV
ncbi:MAG: hypothetical protein ABIH34_08355 [Nanoarchaeota archaeon]